MLKAKYYPWVLIIIFSLFFGLQIDFWCGLAVGYMWHFGLFNFCSVGMAKATEWEQRFPFKAWSEKPYFAKAGESAGGNVLNSGEPVGTVLNRNGGASNFPAPGNPSGSSSNPAAANSSAAAFKSFSGKGHSLGGGSAPSSVQISSILGRNNSGASRGRSTPDTRAGEPQRARNLAESKLVQQSNMRTTSATASSISTEEADLEGHPVEPQE